MRRALLGFAFAVTACQPAPPQAARPADNMPASTEELIALMRGRYDDTWYTTLRFRQRVLQKRPDGTDAPEQVWLEHAIVPGALRIDMGHDYTGDATLFAGDSTYVLREGAVARRVQGGNILVTLGFDVYRQPVAQTVDRLRGEGFDLGVLRRGEWQGRPHYVVGAAAGDTTSAQFWIDAERLVFTRLIQPTPQGRTEIRFDDYQQLAGGWIAPLVIFLRDGREVMREVYFDIEANPSLPEGLLDPARWHQVRPR